MAGCHVLARRLAVPVLVIEEDVRAERFQEFPLGHAAQEQRLVNADVPRAQGADHAFMSRRRPGGDERGTDR